MAERVVSFDVSSVSLQTQAFCDIHAVKEGKNALAWKYDPDQDSLIIGFTASVSKPKTSLDPRICLSLDTHTGLLQAVVIRSAHSVIAGGPLCSAAT